MKPGLLLLPFTMAVVASSSIVHAVDAVAPGTSAARLGGVIRDGITERGPTRVAKARDPDPREKMAVVAKPSPVNKVGAVGPGTSATRLGVAIHDELAERDRAIAARARDLDLREKAAMAYEARLKARNTPVAATAGAAAPPAVGLAPAAAANEDRYESLARIYQAMKPVKAAVIMQQLDMDIQIKVAKAMRERSTAQIIANMEPRAAVALSMSMARERAVAVAPAAKGTGT